MVAAGGGGGRDTVALYGVGGGESRSGAPVGLSGALATATAAVNV